MNAKAGTQAVSLEYDLPHPPAKVWRALTEPALVAAWLMPNDLKPEVGHAFQFRSTPMPHWDGLVSCEVQEVELHKRLRYSWRSGGPAHLDTVVTWTLQPTPAGGTRLTLVHSGFQPDGKWAFEGARKGWEKMLTEKLPKVLSEA